MADIISTSDLAAEVARTLDVQDEASQEADVSAELQDPADRGTLKTDPDVTPEVGADEEGSSLLPETPDEETGEPALAAVNDPADPATPDAEGEAVEVYVLPDGREVSAEEVVAKFMEAPAENPEMKKLQDQIADLTARVDAPIDPGAPAEPDLFDDPAGWMSNRWRQYVAGGAQATPELEAYIRQEHLSEQVRANRDTMQGQIKAQQDREAKSAQETQQAARTAQIETLVGSTPSLQTDTGRKILDMALSHAAANGETDLKKIVQEANELAGGLVQDNYVGPKKAKMALLKKRLPTGGSPRAPVPKDEPLRYTGIDGLMKMTRSAVNGE